MQHVVLQAETGHLLDPGRLGTLRRLDHRELVARFGPLMGDCVALVA